MTYTMNLEIFLTYFFDTRPRTTRRNPYPMCSTGGQGVWPLNLCIQNQLAGFKAFETIGPGIECCRSTQADRFRQDFAYRWRQHEAVTAEAYGEKERRMRRMDPQNGILVGRDIVVPSPAPLQLERGTGGQAPLQLWHNVILETRSVPIKVKAGWLVSDNGGRQEVIIRFGVMPKMDITRVNDHGQLIA